MVINWCFWSASVAVDMACSFDANEDCYMFSRAVQRSTDYKDIWFDSLAQSHSPVIDNTLESGMLPEQSYENNPRFIQLKRTP